MRVALVTGSYPPERCGVGDFAEGLARRLGNREIEVTVVTGADWSAFAAKTLLRRIESTNPDIIHLQYPTAGFKTHLGPHVLSLGRRIVVTLHEGSQVNILRQLSMLVFAMRSQHIVFTTEYERRYAIRMLPWLDHRSCVIPIGSAIPGVEPKGERELEIVYFGLIRPKKGLEEVVRLADTLARRRSPYRVRIMGGVNPENQQYLMQLQTGSASLPIHWDLSPDPHHVGAHLAQARFAYLPFPDGASERRSSMLAAFECELPVITTRSEQTTSDIARAVEFAHNAEEATMRVERLSSPAEYRQALDRTRTIRERFSWPSIISQYRALYERLLEEKQSSIGAP